MSVFSTDMRAFQIGADADPSSTDASVKKKIPTGIKKKRSFQSASEGGYGMTKDMVVLLVKEIARSKDETIQTKNQMIDLLMSRKCSCNQ